MLPPRTPAIEKGRADIARTRLPRDILGAIRDMLPPLSARRPRRDMLDATVYSLPPPYYGSGNTPSRLRPGIRVARRPRDASLPPAGTRACRGSSAPNYFVELCVSADERARKFGIAASVASHVHSLLP